MLDSIETREQGNVFCKKKRREKLPKAENKETKNNTEAARQCERKIDLNPNAIGSARDVKYRRKCL